MPHSQTLFDIETLANHVIGNGDPAVSGADKNRRKISRETLRMELIGFNDDRMTRQKLSQFIFCQLAIGLVWAPHFRRIVAFETHGDSKMDVETKIILEWLSGLAKGRIHQSRPFALAWTGAAIPDQEPRETFRHRWNHGFQPIADHEV